MIAAIYSRKSKFTGKGESVENQIEMCKEYLKRNFNNIDDIEIYEDEGFSGKDTNRTKFKKMIKAAKKKKFNILICYRLDRISRNVADFSNTIEELQ
ncbi:recombinase family protein, partial [Clostridium botulinum]|uniref:recombinase family protein n=1 Tax=Clostridium botulinum TaxID=1491 RepID=UPI001C9B15A0